MDRKSDGTARKNRAWKICRNVLLGIIEIFARAYIGTQLADAVVFAVLIVMLLIRPAGLLGKPVNEKV